MGPSFDGKKMLRVQQLRTLSEVQAQLEEVEERLELLRGEMGSLSSGTTAEEDAEGLEKQLDIFDLLPGKLRPALTEAQRLEEKLTRSAALAMNVAAKVNELELVRTRVREASQRVDDAMEGSRCVSGVTLALAKNDLEEAARLIGKYRSLQLDPSQSLLDATVQVKASLTTQLASAEAAALTSSDLLIVQEVSRLASLLSDVGGEREARSRYCSFVRRRMENMARTRRLLAEKEVDLASTEAKKLGIWASGLSDLFETAAGELMKRLPESVAALSDVVGASVVHAIEDGVGGDAAKMIESYRSICGLSSLTRSGSGASSSAGKTSLTKAEEARLAFLDSVALICSRIFLWRRFCEKQINEQQKHHDSFNFDSSGGRMALESQVNEVVAEYVGLEERFLLSSVQKAIEMDEPNPDSKSGSMVDYVFFILQKASHRAISTLSSDGASAVLNIVIACLDSFLNVQQQMLSASASKAYAPELSGQVPYAVSLNGLATSAEFVGRLKTELEASIKKHFAGNLPGISKVEAIFSELGDMGGLFRKALTSNLQLVAETLDPSLRDIADELDVDYVLTEKEYSARQQDDAAWPRKVIKQTEQLAVPFKKALLPVCYDALSRSIASGLATRLERQVMTKKYNALGALQLSRDISSITHALTAMCPHARSDVARLSQMAVTLSVESCRDVEDLAAGPQWRLTPGETRRLLARRVEFSQHDIASIKL